MYVTFFVLHFVLGMVMYSYQYFFRDKITTIFGCEKEMNDIFQSPISLLDVNSHLITTQK